MLDIDGWKNTVDLTLEDLNEILQEVDELDQEEMLGELLVTQDEYDGKAS